jgi:hypothetical protein
MPAILKWVNLNERLFEELCCQLARSYMSDSTGTFYRVDGRGGDEGVDAFYAFPDGSECGWQAKFFLGRLNRSRWQQIKGSIEQALKCRPALQLYYVCVPIDLTPGESNKWKALADEYCNRIRLELWSASCLEDFLTRPENAGKRAVFFGELELNARWLRDKLDEARVSLGERYTPDARVALPELFHYFEILGRTRRFRDELLEWSNRISDHREHLEHYRGTAAENAQLATYEGLIAWLDKISKLLRQSAELADPLQKLPVEELTKGANEAAQRAWKAWQRLEHLGKSLYAGPIRETATLLRRCIRTVENQKWGLANEVGFALYGEAGVGKSHCLFDVAISRQEEGLFSIFTLGHQFPTNSQPIVDLATLLGFGSHSEEEILGALSSVAESTGAPLLLFIDALNESQKRNYWASHLPALIHKLRRYPWVRIVVSFRTGYRPELMDDHPPIPEIEYPGFAGHETEALSRLCAFYGVEFPSLPVLSPEFHNPLFLHLVLRALRDTRERVWPKGLHGFNQAYRLFVLNCNKRVAQRLNCDPDAGWVRRAIQALAVRMAEYRRDWVAVEEAKQIINGVYPERATQCDYSGSLFRALIDEHVITEDRTWDGATSKWIRAIRFTFQRFADHAIAKQLLTRLGDHPSDEDLRVAFAADGTLDLRSLGPNLAEALAIQLPERVGKELVDYVEWETEDLYFRYLVRTAFLHSLVWRDPKALPPREQLGRYINEKLGGLTDEVFDVLLTVCVRPEHRLNAHTLHRTLSRLSMVERDHLWTLYIYKSFGELGSPIERILDWGGKADFSDVAQECVELFATAVCWLFTSSNRELRDRATNVLARIFYQRLHCAKAVLARFRGVNDLYVKERLYGAVYGACLWHERGHPELLAGLAQWFYDQEFKHGSPLLHILARDYARGVIEVAARGNALPEALQLQKVRPPYCSPWPLEDAPPLPSREQLQERSGLSAIVASLSAGRGDFAHYIVRPMVERFLFDRQKDVQVVFDHALRWIYARISALGYKDDFFADHDLFCTGFFDRIDHRRERIGKKYQWIAFHEYLARVSDHCLLRPDSQFPVPATYDGPWQNFRRDIDPSCWLQGEPEGHTPKSPWWVPFTELLPKGDWSAYAEWAGRKNDAGLYSEWLKDSLRVSDSKGQRWVVAYADYSWRAEKEPGERLFKKPWWEMRFDVRGYLVKDPSAVLEWLQSQNFCNHWMPEQGSVQVHRAFLGEYPWHPSWKEACDRLGWQELTQHDCCLFQFRVPYVTYVWSCPFDFSGNGESRLILPAPWLVEVGDLRFDRSLLAWLDDAGRRVALDPAGISSDHPHVFILDAEWLAEWLNKKGLGFFWVVAGRKFASAGSNGPEVRSFLSGGFLWTGSEVEGMLRFVECEP